MPYGRPHLSDQVYDWATDHLGRVAENPSTITYEFGTGGVLRAIVGYEVVPINDTEPDLLSVLPLRYVGVPGTEDFGQTSEAINGPDSQTITFAALNRDRIVSIIVQARFPEEG